VRIHHPDGPAARLPAASILGFAHYLRDRLRWADTIGRCADTLFLLVMPETNQQDAIRLLSEIQTECTQGALDSLEDNPQPDLSISARAWEKGDDPQRLTQRTLQALEE
jgi:PleD family two-component response regulator